MLSDLASAEARRRRMGQMVKAHEIPWQARARVLAIWLLAGIAGTLVLIVPLPLTRGVRLQVGDVAPIDVTAPRQMTYVSEILTEQRRELAADAVPEVFDAPQARIGRQQLTLVSQLLDYIASVRADSFADSSGKVALLRAVSAVELSPEVTNGMLALPAANWERVAEEAQSVLERAMRAEIRETDLAEERRKVSSQVRLDLPDEEAAIVTQIVQALLVPNSFFNANRTEERRRQASERVEPVPATVERNEVILRAGDLVTPLDMEALEALGLQQGPWGWEEVRSAAGMMLVLGLALVYYFWREEPLFWLERVEPILLAVILILFLLLARSLLPAHTLMPYIFPYATLTMLLSVLFGLRIGLMMAGFIALFTGWMVGGSVELTTYAFCGAVIGALKLRRGERLVSFAWAAGYVAAVNVLVVLAFRLGFGRADWRGLIELSSAAVVNGLVTMTMTLFGIYLAGALFGLTTPLQLMELSRPTHPLLRQLLLKAPGTYHHTLIVSNMAERAAEAIHADAQLTRVGAYYHDVGKSIRPYFFIENRSEGSDPHARLDPYTSAQIIVSHVKDGMDLARKYRLPQRVIDFIPEHQGTLLVSFFYHQAVKQAGSADTVDRSQFAYPGPKPQTRETAITMLADGAEATVRSRRPATIEELNQIIAESIRSRMASGQLDECPLTLGDLQEVQRAFADILRGIHHPRVAYPAEVTATPGETEQANATAATSATS